MDQSTADAIQTATESILRILQFLELSVGVIAIAAGLGVGLMTWRLMVLAKNNSSLWAFAFLLLAPTVASAEIRFGPNDEPGGLNSKAEPGWLLRAKQFVSGTARRTFTVTGLEPNGNYDVSWTPAYGSNGAALQTQRWDIIWNWNRWDAYDPIQTFTRRLQASATGELSLSFDAGSVGGSFADIPYIAEIVISDCVDCDPPCNNPTDCDDDGCPAHVDPDDNDPAVGCFCNDPNDCDGDGCPADQDADDTDELVTCCVEPNDCDGDGCFAGTDQDDNDANVLGPGCAGDCDGDGVPDEDEGDDVDGDGCLAECDPDDCDAEANECDCDGDGCPEDEDEDDEDPDVGCDSDGDGCPDDDDPEPENPGVGCPDCDGDGIPDAEDDDDDDDGIPDEDDEELTCQDCDNDGIPDSEDDDDDGDGIPDEEDEEQDDCVCIDRDNDDCCEEDDRDDEDADMQGPKCGDCDGDGVSDDEDDDMDGDGEDNREDEDDDGDGIPDDEDDQNWCDKEACKCEFSLEESINELADVFEEWGLDLSPLTRPGDNPTPFSYQIDIGIMGEEYGQVQLMPSAQMDSGVDSIDQAVEVLQFGSRVFLSAFITWHAFIHSLATLKSY